MTDDLSRDDVRAKLLLLDPDRKSRRLRSKALGATGCAVSAVETLEAAQEALTDAEYDLVVADYDRPALDGVDQDTYDAFLTEVAERRLENEYGRPRILLLADRRRKGELGQLFRLPFLTNLIAKSHPLTLDELIITVGKIARRDIFGIEKYLCYGVQPIRHTVTSSRQKDALLAAVANYADGLGIGRRLVHVAESVADELIMNAVYNAPTDDEGERPYAARPRTEPVDLGDHEHATFTFACDGRHLVLAMRDPFGSLTGETVRSYLHRCFAMGRDQIEAKSGGAGIGLYFIVEALNKIIINISPGRGTEVIGLIDVSGSFRDYAETYKSFHIFVS